MKSLVLIIGISLSGLAGFSQGQWNTQNSGTTSSIFDICFTDENNGWASGLTGMVLHTSDGGANWEPQDPPPSNVYYGIHFTDPQNGWASGFGGRMIHTTDGGETWAEQNSGLSTDIFSVFFINENIGWAVGGDNGTYPSFIKHRRIIHTTDGGQTWTIQLATSNESLLRSVYFQDQYHGIATGESGIVLVTDDGGTNWEVKMDDLSYHFYGAVLTTSSAYVVGAYLGLPHVSVIFRTDDMGATWISQTFGTDEALSDIFFTDDLNGWAVGGANEVAAILRTDDGGLSWEEQQPGISEGLSCVWFTDEYNGWAAGYQGTIISTKISTGFADKSQGGEFSVYPNPAAEVLNVDLDENRPGYRVLSLIDNTGRLIYKRREVHPGPETLKINTDRFNNGIYTLILEDATGILTRKVVISK